MNFGAFFLVILSIALKAKDDIRLEPNWKCLANTNGLLGICVERDVYNENSASLGDTIKDPLHDLYVTYSFHLAYYTCISRKGQGNVAFIVDDTHFRCGFLAYCGGKEVISVSNGFTSNNGVSLAIGNNCCAYYPEEKDLGNLYKYEGKLKI